MLRDLLVADARSVEDKIEDFALCRIHDIPVHSFFLKRSPAVGEQVAQLPVFFLHNFSFDEQQIKMIPGGSPVNTGIFREIRNGTTGMGPDVLQQESTVFVLEDDLDFPKDEGAEFDRAENCNEKTDAPSDLDREREFKKRDCAVSTKGIRRPGLG